VFDGFSVGSNDLTQLVLGVDRDSELVAHLFDERNAAVKRMITEVIHAAQAAGGRIGICGQAPSDYPDFARFLVAEGIDSISLNPGSSILSAFDLTEPELAATFRMLTGGADDSAGLHDRLLTRRFGLHVSLSSCPPRCQFVRVRSGILAC
jgi:hypothetical protein